ncbi:MAG: hypothetical protein ACLFMS_02965, partial [Halorhodospira sp.]
REARNSRHSLKGLAGVVHELLAIEALVLAQAVDLAFGEAFPTAGRALHGFIRRHPAPLVGIAPCRRRWPT